MRVTADNQGFAARVAVGVATVNLLLFAKARQPVLHPLCWLGCCKQTLAACILVDHLGCQRSGTIFVGKDGNCSL